MNDAPSACVGVVLVNWNGWTYTVAAARSLDQSDYRNLKIIIVDNASSDDSLAQLRAAIPHADIIANPVNAGFSGGCNIGIRRAIEQGCAYVFLLNNDALVENSTIAKLVDASKVKNDTALLGSSIVYVSSGEYQFFGSQTAAVLGGSDRFDIRFQGHLLSQDFIKTDVVLGAALFLPAKVLDRTGLFDERFFLDYEETDLCYRARKLGSGMLCRSLIADSPPRQCGDRPRRRAHAILFPHPQCAALRRQARHLETAPARLSVSPHGALQEHPEVVAEPAASWIFPRGRWRAAFWIMPCGALATARQSFANTTPVIADRPMCLRPLADSAARAISTPLRRWPYPARPSIAHGYASDHIILAGHGP